jgi:ribonuclease P protein component
MPNLRFPKRLRLLHARDYARVLAARATASDGVLLVRAAANDLGHPRLGLTVSRAVGSGVVRNRWKRVLREAFRLAQHDLPALDLIVSPRASVEPDIRRVSQSLRSLAARIEKRLARCGSPKSERKPRSGNAP